MVRKSVKNRENYEQNPGKSGLSHSQIETASIPSSAE